MDGFSSMACGDIMEYWLCDPFTLFLPPDTRHEQADLDLTDIPLRIRICLFKPADSPSHKIFPGSKSNIPV